jgi:hypothetical protein
MMSLLTKEEILQAEDLPTEDVEVPEWGGTVRVRTLKGYERDKFEESITDQQGKTTRVIAEHLRAKLVALSVVDEDGTRLFDEQDVRRLSGKSAKALDRVFAVAQRLSGISNDDVEELVKNSSDGPSASSGSA